MNKQEYLAKRRDQWNADPIRIAKRKARLARFKDGLFTKSDLDFFLDVPIWKSGGYLAFKINGKYSYVHKWIMGVPYDRSVRVDHINGNRLDNRRENLRICTHAENVRNRPKKNKNNTSGHPGVWWHAQAGKWAAEIKLDYKKISLGLFSSLRDASEARRTAELQYFGEFATAE